MGVVDFAFVPVEIVSDRADEIYLKAKMRVEQLDKEGRLPPGLKEQYEIQLERLQPRKNQSGPGCEIIGVPGIPGSGTHSLFLE